MSKLSSKSRKAIPKSDFGLPGSRKYPMPDKSHAANAKARATQQVKAGNLSPSAKAKIDAKADRVMGVSDAPAKGSPAKKAAPASFKAHEFKKGGSKEGSAVKKYRDGTLTPPKTTQLKRGDPAFTAPVAPSQPQPRPMQMRSAAPVSNMESGHAAMFRKAFSGKSG